MSTDSVLRRSWTVLTGSSRGNNAVAESGESRRQHGLARRVVAILVGVDLPVAAASGSVRNTHDSYLKHLSRSGDGPGRGLSSYVNKEVAEYEYFFKTVKSYIKAEAPDRVQSRLYALASLKNLDQLVRIAAAENSFQGLDLEFLRLATTFRSTDSSVRTEISHGWAHVRSCQHYFASAHQRTLREAVAQVGGFTIEYRNNRLLIRAGTERQSDLEYYMRLLKELRSEAAAAGGEVLWWRSRIVIEIDPRIYGRGPAMDLIRRLETEPSRKIEQNLGDVRDALAVASHDFIGADLRQANLEDVPLGGIRWDRTTRWPRSWLRRLRSLSTEVEPGILRIDGRHLLSG